MTDNDSILNLERKRCAEFYYENDCPERAIVEEHMAKFAPFVNENSHNIAFLAVEFIKALGQHDYEMTNASDLAGFVLADLGRVNAAAQGVLESPLDIARALTLVDLILGDSLVSPKTQTSRVAAIWTITRENAEFRGILPKAQAKVPGEAETYAAVNK